MKKVKSRFPQKLYLRKLLNALISITFFSFFLMCTNATKDSLQVNFSSGIDSVISKYKHTLKAESILITQDKINDTAYMVHIIILEPQEFPNREPELEQMTNELASEFYSLLVNKSGYEEVLVEIAFREYNAGGTYRKINNAFKSSELTIKTDN